MPRLTIADALREMRGLHPVDAGRLTASRVYASSLTRPEQWVADTPTPCRERLLTGITDRYTGTITPHTPEYLVLSDRVVVVVLTVTARIVLPDYPLSALQTRHQTAAARVLRDLPRDTLRDLADARAGREGRHADRDAEYDKHPEGALRVAPADDPTNTRWTRIGVDLSAARDILAPVCRTQPDQVLIVTASGYGAYGQRCHRLEIPVLCAMHHLADTHQVSLEVVGDWLDIEGATTSHVSPATIRAQFDASHLGAFPDRATYLRTRIAALGWTQALAAAGIPERYLDLRAIDRDWFDTHVRDLVSDRHIEVFTREPSDTPAREPVAARSHDAAPRLTEPAAVVDHDSPTTDRTASHAPQPAPESSQPNHSRQPSHSTQPDRTSLPTVQRLLAHLGQHPDVDFSPHELARVINSSDGTVRKHLLRLAGQGEVRRTQQTPARFQIAASAAPGLADPAPSDG